MRTNLILLFALLFAFSSPAQLQEFKLHDNGLIYGEQTMQQLSHIVDSLNLYYSSCDLERTYYAIPQTVGQLVRMSTGDMAKARRAMDRQIAFTDFVEQFPEATIDTAVLIVRSDHRDGERGYIRFSQIDLQDGYGTGVYKRERPAYYMGDLTNKWVYEYTPPGDYHAESLTAFYFPDGFYSPALPESYARMIGYADCLIDTTTTKFKEDAEEGWVDLPPNWRSLPPIEQQALLNEMRSTQVVGFCSQDSRPRDHAIHIALLSAETANWEVFLRSHLDIMNDRFDRMSDGSYAWGARGTYLRELEELRINVLDLIFGIAIAIENPAPNHYFGSINRLGRALAESRNQGQVRDRILSMIEDDKLDDYNRVVAYFLFMNYNHHVEDESVNSRNREMLQRSVQKLPPYLQASLPDD